MDKGYKEVCICPFDKNHIVEATKIKKHIEKCKSPTRANFQQCKYDPYHWFKPNLIEKHEKSNNLTQCRLSIARQGKSLTGFQRQKLKFLLFVQHHAFK